MKDQNKIKRECFLQHVFDSDVKKNYKMSIMKSTSKVLIWKTRNRREDVIFLL